eukprot:530869-Pyramimonas_sp.AAC.1
MDFACANKNPSVSVFELPQVEGFPRKRGEEPQSSVLVSVKECAFDLYEACEQRSRYVLTNDGSGVYCKT